MINLRLPRTLAVITTLALAACDSTVQETSTGGTTSTGHGGQGGAGTGGGGTGGTGLPACEVQGESDTSIELFECALPAPCPEAHFYFGIEPGSGSTQPPPHFSNPEAATCILEKLRDREISALNYTSNPEWDYIGQFTHYATTFILDADHGASNSVTMGDLSKTEARKNRQILKPSSYFEACLSETDPTAIYECIEGWSAGCADVDVPCPTK
ncbi:Hypothetical protein A7982_05746 [Minicystis rosea]|nr:Hypothetical protein A7982_05746 [Minicystis rosea]